jgi:myosin heavy subunit
MFPYFYPVFPILRYIILAPKAMKNTPKDEPKQACIACLDDIEFDKEKFRIGNTKARNQLKTLIRNQLKTLMAII